MKIIKKTIIMLFIAWGSALIIINSIGKKLNSSLLNYVNIESKRIASNVVNSIVNETIATKADDDLFEITKNTRGEIELLDYKTKEVNNLLKLTTENILKTLQQLENGTITTPYLSSQFKKGRFSNAKSGIICEVPIGTTKQNVLYANFGPYIPIRMSFLGSVNSYITSNIKSYGFNSVFIEVFIHVEIEELITLPTTSQISKINIQAPITMKIIQGVIPEYYYTKGLEKISNQYSTND